MKMVKSIARGSMLAAALSAGCGDDGGNSTGTAGPDTTAPSSSSATTPTSEPTTGPGTHGSSGGHSAGETLGTSGGPTTGPGPVTMATSVTTATTTTTATGTTTATTATTATSTSDTTGDDTTGGATGLVRFIALGDVGEGNEDQYQVADAIVAVCEQRGCDWAMLTGDNFYDSGVDGVDDPQWQEKFELPYADIDFPIYAVLGNHDYGGDGIGVDLNTSKSDYQVEYTDHSPRWRMPDKYYGFVQDHVEVWALDTNQVMTDPFNGNSDTQLNWLKQSLAQSTAPWKIAFGHHPYLSNGEHGNAGDYENLEGIPLPFVAGESVKDFIEDAVCGAVDVYICGHDHTIQWLQAKCGTEFIVSGAGSKANNIEGNNPEHYQVAETEGFLWVEISDNTFTGVFYDKNGNELYTRTINK